MRIEFSSKRELWRIKILKIRVNLCEKSIFIEGKSGEEYSMILESRNFRNFDSDCSSKNVLFLYEFFLEEEKEEQKEMRNIR